MGLADDEPADAAEAAADSVGDEPEAGAELAEKPDDEK